MKGYKIKHELVEKKDYVISIILSFIICSLILMLTWIMLFLLFNIMFNSYFYNYDQTLINFLFIQLWVISSTLLGWYFNFEIRFAEPFIYEKVEHEIIRK